jgi:hypothetical protein
MMEALEIKGLELTYRNNVYVFHEYEIIDDKCIHLHLNEGIYAIILPCIINTQVINTLEEFKTVMK